MSSCTLYYWPALGRSIGVRLLLEDSGKPFDRVNYAGGQIHPSVVAVPAVCIDGTYVSQTMAIMEVLSDTYGYVVPEKAYNKALQTTLNIYDIFGEAVDKRGSSIKTEEAAKAFVNTRARAFFAAVEAGYKTFPGPLFYEDRPSMADFQLLGTVTVLSYLFGEGVVGSMVAEAAPTAQEALRVMRARPNIAAFFSSGFKGESIMPASMNLGAELLLGEAPAAPVAAAPDAAPAAPPAAGSE